MKTFIAVSRDAVTAASLAEDKRAGVKQADNDWKVGYVDENVPMNSTNKRKITKELIEQCNASQTFIKAYFDRIEQLIKANTKSKH